MVKSRRWARGPEDEPNEEREKEVIRRNVRRESGVVAAASVKRVTRGLQRAR